MDDLGCCLRRVEARARGKVWTSKRAESEILKSINRLRKKSFLLPKTIPSEGGAFRRQRDQHRGSSTTTTTLTEQKGDFCKGSEIYSKRNESSSKVSRK